MITVDNVIENKIQELEIQKGDLKNQLNENISKIDKSISTLKNALIELVDGTRPLLQEPVVAPVTQNDIESDVVFGQLKFATNAGRLLPVINNHVNIGNHFSLETIIKLAKNSGCINSITPTRAACAAALLKLVKMGHIIHGRHRNGKRVRGMYINQPAPGKV